jgi:hypothetical protein
MATIFDEQVEIADDIYKAILDISYKKPHDFIFIDTNSQDIYVNWDKVIINDE